MTPLDERKSILKDLQDAIDGGARSAAACELVGLSTRTFQRWLRDVAGGDKRSTVTRLSPIAFSNEEKNSILSICTNNHYKDLSPNVIVPLLAQKGIYLGSESTFYRILREANLLTHRSESRIPKPRQLPEHLIATGPNQLCSWDITYLKTKIRGIYFYLYLFMDVWSRKIIGWSIEDREDGILAAQLITEICLKQGIGKMHLHSDNGKPMKCGTMLATLQWLGVEPSFSRPGVSNDNPFSESLFKTMKYCPAYPSHFDSIDEARRYVSLFVSWYNTEHIHSGIKYVTPEQRHTGVDLILLEKREETYCAAKIKNPGRWSGHTRNWKHLVEVSLNKRKIENKKTKCA